ncbi:hypothetical protein DMH27_05590 [Raoultella planticola]|nr:hypothetical protein [Raoultella planticola]
MEQHFISGLILPGVLVAQSVPVVAMVPVISRVIGYDVRSVIAITVLISFFPAYVFSRSGLTRLPAGAKDLSVSLAPHVVTSYFARLSPQPSQVC